MPTRRSHLLAHALLAWLAAPAHAQSVGAPVFGEIVDVRVIDLEVVVSDGRGRVRGLSRSDFRLEVDGEPVPIELFTEVSGGRAAGAGAHDPARHDPARHDPAGHGGAVGTHVLVFVDDYFALPAERNRALAAIVRDLPRLGPDDRMAIVAFDGRRLTSLAGWTRSLPQLQAALEQARGRAAFGLLRRGEQRRFDAFSRLVPRAGRGFLRGAVGSAQSARDLGATELLRAKEVVAQVGRVVAAGSAALRGFAAAPARKVMLLLAGGWPISPAVWQTGALERPAPDEGLVAGRNLLAPLIETANRLGYTLYPVDVPGTGHHVDAADTGSTVLEAGALDARREEIERDALGTLAVRTGGKVLQGGARLDPLAGVLRDLEHYYRLGFAPRWKGDGREHAVRVALSRPGLRVRVRTGYLDLARSAEVSMLLESAQLFDQPLPEAGALTLALGVPRAGSRGQMRLPIELSAPWAELALVPAGDGPPGGTLGAELELRAVAIDDEGALSDVPVVPVRLTRNGPPAAGERFVYAFELELRRREQSLLVALYQPASGKLLAARTQVMP